MKKYSSIPLFSTIAVGIIALPVRSQSEAANSEDIPFLTAMTCR